MPFDSADAFAPLDPSELARIRALPHIVVRPKAPPNAPIPEGIDDWIAPGEPFDGPDDWIAPANAPSNTSYSNDWFVPPPPAMQGTGQFPPDAELNAANSWNAYLAVRPDLFTAYWSQILASRIGALTWLRRIWRPWARRSPPTISLHRRRRSRSDRGRRLWASAQWPGTRRSSPETRSTTQSRPPGPPLRRYPPQFPTFRLAACSMVWPSWHHRRPVPESHLVACWTRWLSSAHRARLLQARSHPAASWTLWQSSGPETVAAAKLILYMSMGFNVGHGGAFDYQRSGNQFLGLLTHGATFTQLPQFRSVSDVNVGLFCQQAGLTLDETLSIAGRYPRLFSSNSKPDQPDSLDPITAQFIITGYNLGQSGIFDPPPTR
jgi:hypothetical protein